jgi:capsular polysaccharide biosynthesis protein
MQNIRETPLKERFEAASKEFQATFSRKARNAGAAWTETYSNSEFNKDLLKAAQENGLFPEALWAYFKALHTGHQIDGSFARKRFGENKPLRPRGSEAGGVKRSEKALLPTLRGVMASLLVALCVVAHGLYQTPIYEASIKILVGQKEPPQLPSGIHPLPNANSEPQDSTLLVARAVPTTPIAQAVVKRLNLPRGSASKVVDNTSVEADPGTMFVDITYRDSDPKRAQLVANAIGQVASQKVSEVRLASPRRSPENRLTAALWQPAMLPAAPVSPNPLRNGLLALVASLTLASGWTVLLSRSALTTHRSL